LGNERKIVLQNLNDFFTLGWATITYPTITH
jgi:hypothetical protein